MNHGIARFGALFLIAAPISLALAQTPDNLVVDGIPAAPDELKRDAGRYLEFRSASFQSWHPARREMLITTRFADTAQLHLVREPGGARRQLTFFAEPVPGGAFGPKAGDCIVFSQDTGGGEFYQLYRYDVADARVTLLTDGKSRNMSPRWARSGKQLAYTSTRRNGRDNDIYIVNPLKPESGRLAAEVKGGGWSVQDWSPDEDQLLVVEYIAIDEGYLHLLDLKTGKMENLTPKSGQKYSVGGGRFSRDGKAVYLTTESRAEGGGKKGEFQMLARLDLRTREFNFLTRHISWNVDAFELSPDGRMIAFVTNEDGVGVLRLLDTRSGKELAKPKLPLGIVSALEWHDNRRDLGFALNSARSPMDAYSLDVKSGRVTRWTESETGGLDAATFVEPELIRLKSFDGLALSGFLYRPDVTKFPGKRPVLVSIHGGPEAQSRPSFQARNNYYLNELGVAILYPNVRGSDGYGATFLGLDNGFKREDSVKDIGAFLDWIERDSRLDSDRIGVMGGSYGGYMVLASLVHFSDRLRCGIDVVGISNFLTFLKNTQDYRRDLRRVEYGDERDPAMRDHLEKISPTKNVSKIRKPLLVVQGQNDPRVPATESEQMVKAIRDHGGTVWYLMARDEGHGFQKKKNADFQFLSTIQFVKLHLLN